MSHKSCKKLLIKFYVYKPHETNDNKKRIIYLFIQKYYSIMLLFHGNDPELMQLKIAQNILCALRK